MRSQGHHLQPVCQKAWTCQPSQATPPRLGRRRSSLSTEMCLKQVRRSPARAAQWNIISTWIVAMYHGCHTGWCPHPCLRSLCSTWGSCWQRRLSGKAAASMPALWCWSGRNQEASECVWTLGSWTGMWSEMPTHYHALKSPWTPWKGQGSSAPWIFNLPTTRSKWQKRTKRRLHSALQLVFSSSTGCLLGCQMLLPHTRGWCSRCSRRSCSVKSWSIWTTYFSTPGRWRNT